MKNIFIILAILLTSCSSYSKTQALSDCSFSEVKTSNINFIEDASERRESYIYSCMNSKGYKLTIVDGCISYPSSEFCWDYSWRVFL